jgi:hypothetical protein
MKLIKAICMSQYEIKLYKLENMEYLIRYKILNQEFEGENIRHYEFADILFDIKHQELDNATTTLPQTI